jgi:nicotinate (nicotinamide) nucleotide adenylyltransferase
MPAGSAKEKLPTLRWLRRATQGIASGRTSQVSQTGVTVPRLGVLSGTFNPPTRAHIALAEAASTQLKLDEVLFVLPEVPPHKTDLEASLEERAQMLWVAVQEHPQFSAALVSHGLFLDIHRAVAPHYPAETEIIFLVGKDAAERILLDWPYENLDQALAEMFAHFSFAVAVRSGNFRVPAGSAAEKYATKIIPLDLAEDVQEVSATRARKCAARGEELGEIVPDAVAEMIENRGLYRGERKKIYKN